MKKFLFRIFIYSFLILGVCFLIQYFVDAGLHKYNSGNYGIWNKIFAGEINSDIIILGSSRAKGHFNPKIIENKTGLSCYNLGIGAGKIILENAMWESLLKYNHPPKIVIQNVDLFSLYPEKNIVFKKQFLSYLSEPTIYSNLNKIDNKLYFENIIPLYKYRGYREMVFRGIKSYFNIGNSHYADYNKGYDGPKKEWNIDFENFKSKNKKIVFSSDDMKLGINFLKNLIKDCKSKHIEIILVQTPIYFELQDMMPQKDYFDSFLYKMAKDHDVLFLDYSKDSLSYNKVYFYNSMHLNDRGAGFFSQHLAEDLNYFIKNNQDVKSNLTRVLK